MKSITLKINEKIYDKFLWLLKQFKKEDIQIIDEDVNFDKNKEYLQGEAERISKGETKFFSLNEAEQRLEKVIKKHENNS